MIQERIKNNFKKIKIPLSNLGADRGYKQCCTAELVLANGSVNSWENDITPIWIKLSDPADTFQFNIKTCNGEDIDYVIQYNGCPNENNAYFGEIHWKDVLSSDGVGKYKLSIDYTISGIPGVIEWGIYELKRFTTENALTTARLRAVFNNYQEIEDINFKGSNMQGTVRFNGYIGNEQPKKYIDNLIYSNRRVGGNIRENLPEHDLLVDPSSICIISKISKLYLLSEVELYASDYNAFNPSYDYNDIPVTIDESEEIKYTQFNRLPGLEGKLVDRFKNKRSFFK